MKKSLLLLVFLIAVIALVRCTPRNEIEAARYRGQMAGLQDGTSAGDADGFAYAFPKSRSEAYSSTLNTLYETHQFRRKPLLTAAALVVSFAIGFLLQYLLLYLMRRWGVPDIDRIVLPRDLTEVKFNKIHPAAKKRRVRPQPTSLLMLLVVTSSFLSRCENDVEKAYKISYDANYAAAYPNGFVQGDTRGREEGTAAGNAAAHKAAQNGEAWQLYSRLAASALAAGLVIGLGLQYAILLGCRRSGRLNQLQTVLLVPAMRRSLAYVIFENCRKLELEKKVALQRVHADSAVKKAELEAAYESNRRRIIAAASIEEISSARLVEFADEEFSRIIARGDEMGTIGEEDEHE